MSIFHMVVDLRIMIRDVPLSVTLIHVAVDAIAIMSIRRDDIFRNRVPNIKISPPQNQANSDCDIGPAQTLAPNQKQAETNQNVA